MAGAPRPSGYMPDSVERGKMKQAILAALQRVDRYEDHLTQKTVEEAAANARSVGLSYKEIQTAMHDQFPGRWIPLMTIRSYARDAKQEGLELPYRRPYSRRQDRRTP